MPRPDRAEKHPHRRVNFNVLTQRNGKDRTGINSDETLLTTSNVNLNTFGKLGSYPVDGDVYAQPLYVSRVKLRNGDVTDLLIVATMNNSVFAFRAGRRNFHPHPVWITSLGSAVSAQIFGDEDGPYKDIVYDPKAKDDRYRTSKIGILGTPVIDITNNSVDNSNAGTIYVVSFSVDQKSFKRSQSASEFKHFLHALNLSDGKRVQEDKLVAGEVSGGGYATSPRLAPGSESGIEVAADCSFKVVTVGSVEVKVVDARNLTSPADASVQFNSMMQLQRPGLLLHEGKVVIAFGSRADQDPFHGWIFAYDARTFELAGLVCTTPNGGRGGIWQAGQGLLVDSQGNIYAGTGNGDSTGPAFNSRLSGQWKIYIEDKEESAGLQRRNLGEAFIQLRVGPTGLRVYGWFNAFDDFSRKDTGQPAGDPTLWTADDDLGASAPALLPDDRIVGGGKDGWFYLIDPDFLDKAGSRQAVPQAFKAAFNFERGSRNTINENGMDLGTHHIHGTPVVWKGPRHTFVYVWGENDLVRAYQYAPEANGDPKTGRFIGQPQGFDFSKPPAQGIDWARGNIYASNEVPNRGGMPGGFLSLSVNGVDGQDAILWAAFPPFHNASATLVEGALIAYDARNFDSNLGFKRLRMLWSSLQNTADQLGFFSKFCCPTIANGRVYQAGGKQVAVYGIKKTEDGGYRLNDGSSPTLPLCGNGLVLNGSASVTREGAIRLTDHPQQPRYPPGPVEPPSFVPPLPPPTFHAGSFFSTSKVDIRRFQADFAFRIDKASRAYGFTFTIQAESPNAIGSAGSGLGYSIDTSDPTPQLMQNTITHSFAVTFVLVYSNGSRIGFMLNGRRFPGLIYIDPDLDIHNGNLIRASLRYANPQLSLELQDSVRNVTTTRFRVRVGDIGMQIGSIDHKAFVGFTGGSGDQSARQEIVTFDYRTPR
jgi:hypothetical protein